MAKKKKQKGSCLIKFLILGFILSIVVAGAAYYYIALKPNVKTKNHKKEYLYIKTGSSYQDVLNSLKEEEFIVNNLTFFIWAKVKKYDELVKPGRYEIKHGMDNNTLVNMLRAGLQKPIKLTFNNIRLKEELAGKVSQHIEADSTDIITELNNTTLKEYAINQENVLLLFIPNSYEMYWNTSATQLIQIMIKEYQKFWNSSNRLETAKKIGYTPAQVGILASIVAGETSKQKEMPTIAGVYINRLKRGMLLQADPTVVFATKDFNIRRVFRKHLDIDSPYNTYKYIGLPPRPIRMPDKFVIDAVLNYEKHKYIFFCADENFTGYHNFAENITQHNINAQKYRRALSKKGIK